MQSAEFENDNRIVGGAQPVVVQVENQQSLLSGDGTTMFADRHKRSFESTGE